MKLKRFALALVLLCLALVFILPGKAEAASSGYYIYTVSGGKATITDCNTSISGDVTIPSTLGGYPVTAIDDNAFSSCSGLTSIAVPNSVNSIGRWAFAYCTDLISITLPDSVSSIGMYAFDNCRNLKTVTIPYGVSSVGNCTFRDCQSLTSIKLPDSVSSIGRYAFSGCRSLKTIEIGSGVANIGDNAFEYNTNIEHIYLSENNTAYCIDDRGVLYNQTKTELLRAPSGLTGDYTIPDTVTKIWMGAFAGCSDLTSLTTPVVDYAYEDDPQLMGEQYRKWYPIGYLFGTEAYEGSVATTQYYRAQLIDEGDRDRSAPNQKNTYYGPSITYYIPASLKSVTVTADIPVYAFNHLDCLETVVIGKKVTYIGEKAFVGCNLKQVIYCGTEEQWYNINIGTNNEPLTSTILQYHQWTSPEAAQEAVCIHCGVTKHSWENDEYKEGYYTYKVSDGEAIIIDCDESAQGALTIPNTLGGYVVCEIADGAFSNCTGLRSVIIPNNVGNIGYGAFRGCSNLESFKTPVVGYIKSELLSNGTEEKTVYPIGYLFGTESYTGGVATEQTYLRLTGGNEVQSKLIYYIPSSFKSVTITADIPKYAFENCTNLETVILSNGVTRIGAYIFRNCSNLKTVTIADGALYVGNAVFQNCRSLETITIPGTLTIIGKYAFDSCVSLRQVIYCGTEAQWNAISIGSDNAPLNQASLQYHDCMDGICIICGAKGRWDIYSVARAKNLSLKDVIYMKATVAFLTKDGNNAQLTKEEILENGRLLFWREKEISASATIHNATLVQQLNDSGIYDDGIQEYYAYSHGIAPAEYGDTIYYCTYIMIDGVEYYGEMHQYSVLTYANNQFKRESSTLKPLLAAMLNYGAAAQVNFGYKTENLANAGLQDWVAKGLLDEKYLTMQWDDALLNTPYDPSSEMVVNFRESGAQRTARSLSLQGMVQPKMTFAYKLADGKGTKLPAGGSVTFYYWSAEKYISLEDESRTLSKHNASYVLTGEDIQQVYSAKYGYEYTAYFEGIPAKQLGEALYIAAVFTMADGTEYCSGVEVYSPEMYAESTLAKTSTTENLANLLKWMVIYGEEAKNYYA